MTVRKLQNQLRDRFGKVPDWDYLSGDMDNIQSYYEYRRDTGRDAFLLDDTTWNDLDMDRLFVRVNPRRCTSGEQYLYYQMRSPALDRETWEDRRELIKSMEADPARRLKIETVLARLGCTRRADPCKAFNPSRHGQGMLLVYGALLLGLLAAAVCAAFKLSGGAQALALALIVNLSVHELGRRRSRLDYDTVNYTVGSVFALRRLQKLRDPELDRHLAGAYGSLDRLRPVLRTGGLATAPDSGGLYDVFASLTLVDLITYEFLKNRLGRSHEEVFAVHEALGRLDAAISIASYRQSVGAFCEPELDFTPGVRGEVAAKGLTHPLLKEAVPNDLITNGPILITGSNASGKSTYLKTAALAAVMAQSLCTVTAESYRGSAFRVFSSMALRDDLLAGESYYLAETRSLKRILDAAREEGPLLCAVDEVLRGTNTVERIAASAEVLAELARAGVLCLAATHDIELCRLLEGPFRLFHFEERLGEGEMLFDYRLRPGKAVSRNAIDLLRLMGFDRALVERAHDRASRYLETGLWAK